MAADLDKAPEWRRSTWCNGGNCVEATVRGDTIFVRVSSDPGGLILAFSPAAWQDFIFWIKQVSHKPGGVVLSPQEP